MGGWRRLVFGVYLVFLAGVIFWPVTGDLGEPRVSTDVDLRGFLSGGVHNQNLQNLQNLVLLVPFGFLLPVVTRWGAARVAVACALLPAGLEGGQYLISLVIGHAYRSTDVDDWIANTAGGLLGLALHAQRGWFRGSGRRAALVSALAVGAAGAGLWAVGPAPVAPGDGLSCEGAPPSGAIMLFEGYRAWSEAGLFCLTYPGGSLATPPGSPDPFTNETDDETVIIGEAPARAARVAVAEAGDAELRRVGGMLIYAVRVPAPGPGITFYAADGTALPPG